MMSVAWSLSAQKLTNSQKRKLNLSAVEMVERYELYSRLSDKSTRYNFTKLFSSSSDMIYCDFYNDGDNFDKQMTVSKYVTFAQDHCESIDINITDVKKDRVYYQSGKWFYVLTFNKELSYNDKNGVLFPVHEDAVEPFKLEMLIEFDESTDEVRIRHIKSISGKAKSAGEKLYIVQKTDRPKLLKKESKVTVDGNCLDYNSFGQAAVSSLGFRFPDEDVTVLYDYLVREPAYDLIELKYSAKRLRTKLHTGIAPVAYTLNKRDEGIRYGSFAYEFGADIGFTFPIDDETKGGFFAGVGVVYSSLRVSSTKNPDYELIFTNRNGGFNHYSYDIGKISQTASFTDFAIPIYLNVERKLQHNIDLVADIGTKVYLNSQDSNSKFVAKYKVADQNNPDISGDGSSELIWESKKIRSTDRTAVNRSQADVSLFFNVGADVELIDRLLYLEAKVGYERGFSHALCEDDKSIMSYDKPIIYSAATNNDKLIVPVYGGFTFVRNLIWLDLGLKLKF